MNEYNILVISCNCFSQTSNNGKTFSNLLRNYPQENIAQFYTYNEVPDYQSKSRFFRITDRDIINQRLKNTSKCGNMVFDVCDVSPTVTLKKKHFEHLKRLIRDLIWKKTNWYYKGLLEWSDSFKPDLIFFVGLNNPYLYDLCLFLQNRYDIPVEVYITDDYLHGRFSLSPFYWIRLHSLRKRFSKLYKNKTTVITINEVMQKAYQKIAGRECPILTNYIASEYVEYVLDDKKIRSIVYIGNLLHGRWKAIIDFAKLLQGCDYIIEVYSGGNINHKIRKKILSYKNIKIGGSLNREQVLQTIKGADYVLHVESFKYSDICLARYSLSTKITEYAAYCKPIIAYCPPQVASYKVLKNNDLAICFEKSKVDVLESQMRDSEKLRYVVFNAYNYFSNQFIQYDMYNEIDNIYMELNCTNE